MIKLATTTAYDTKEVAEMLHRSVASVRNYLRSGELKGQKVGNEWYVTDKTLTEFIAGKYEGKDKV